APREFRVLYSFGCGFTPVSSKRWAADAEGVPFWYATGMDTLLSRITIDPEVCHGKPCIRGLRYPAETLLELLSSGMTIDEILADYEDLERDDLLAVLAFAARLVRTRRLQPAGP
ncbi:MAG TPA: DUF433 domain-containing protein, partial [Isosphaeraceae bacterium]